MWEIDEHKEASCKEYKANVFEVVTLYFLLQIPSGSLLLTISIYLIISYSFTIYSPSSIFIIHLHSHSLSWSNNILPLTASLNSLLSSQSEILAFMLSTIYFPSIIFLDVFDYNKWRRTSIQCVPNWENGGFRIED